MKAADGGYKETVKLLGIIYLDKGHYEDAKKYLMRGAQDNCGESMHMLGIIHSRLRDFKTAETYYWKAINVGRTDAYFSLGLIYHYEDPLDFKKAEEYYLKACEAYYVNVYYYLASLYMEMNRLAEAKKYFLLSLEKCDDNREECAKMHKNLAIIETNSESEFHV